MGSKAKKERRQQRAAGIVPELDLRRAEEREQARIREESRQAHIATEKAKRDADPEKYDQEQAQANGMASRKLASLLGAIGMLSAGVPDMRRAAPRQRSRYY